MSAFTKRIKLKYQAPYNWAFMLRFLAMRCIPLLETVSDTQYQRLVVADKRLKEESLPDNVPGTITVSNIQSENALELKLEFPEPVDTKTIIASTRRLFDLDADSKTIDQRLRRDKLLGKLMKAEQGIRVPGAWSPFEIYIRAILGQQISVAATTFATRVVEKYGQSSSDTDNNQNLKLFPDPEKLSRARLESIGLTKTRAQTVRELSKLCNREICLTNFGTNANDLRNILQSVKGIGPWTAQYCAMRICRDPDAFPNGDLVLIKAASQGRTPINAKALDALAEQWRPYRAYATMYLWNSLSF